MRRERHGTEYEGELCLSVGCRHCISEGGWKGTEEVEVGIKRERGSPWRQKRGP